MYVGVSGLGEARYLRRRVAVLRSWLPVDIVWFLATARDDLRHRPGYRIIFEVEDDLLPIVVLLGGATGRRASAVVVGGPVSFAQSADEVPRTGDRFRVFICLVMDTFFGVFLRIHTRNTVLCAYVLRCREIFL